jgi:hypothetical protein
VAAVKPSLKPVPRLEDEWHEARLIPTTGAGGAEEQEQRATSSLLAVMRGVPDFGRALLLHLGAPAGHIRTFTEVHFLDANERTARPDGGIVVERGKTRWTCLVEVKTSGVPLRADQVDRYLDLARVHEIDAVLTISNQITSSPAESPVVVDGRRTRKVTLRHLSWWQVMTEARLQRDFRGITDPDQAWILGELIAYLDNEKSGAGGFEDMGDKWVPARDAARQRTLRATDPAARDVASHWEEFVNYLALGLRQNLGRDVAPIWPKTPAGTSRVDLHSRFLAEAGRLNAAIRIPDAAGLLEIEVDLRTRQVTTGLEIPAPREGRPRTKVNWLLRQLKDAPSQVRIDVRFANVRDTSSMLLKEAREKPDKLLLAADPKRDPRMFRVALSKDMGTKRGKLAGSFVLETKQQVLDFYRLVLQQLRVWTAVAPKLPEKLSEGPLVASPEPPEFSAPGREPGEGAAPEEAGPAETRDS